MAPLNLGVLKYLIFDLDDTLFDTFGLLVGPAARESCVKMIETGLNTDLETASNHRNLLLKTKKRINIFEALVTFFGVVPGIDPKLVIDAGFRSFHDREIKEKIKLFPDTVVTLNRLKESYGLYLVTLGTPNTQKAKTEKLALEPFFRKIFYIDVHKIDSKQPAFIEILNETQAKPIELASIGNRLDREIKDAKELGMQTIYMRHGEYLYLEPSNIFEVPDAQIDQLNQLIPLLKLAEES